MPRGCIQRNANAPEPTDKQPSLSARLFPILGLLRHESVKTWVRRDFVCHCFPLEIVRSTQVNLNSSTCRKTAFLISIWRTEFPWWRGVVSNLLMSWYSLARTAGLETQRGCLHEWFYSESLFPQGSGLYIYSTRCFLWCFQRYTPSSLHYI